MVFLNPTILFGLLAASIPVLIHMLNLRKLKKVEFSTLSFLKELQKTKIRRIKFKQWLLLALRVLIIIFLVASFARPALETTAIGTASAAKTSTVIILDNSYSMAYVRNEGSSFNKAKKSIIELMENFKSGDEITLLLTSTLENNQQSFTTNFKELQNNLSAAEIGMIPASINRSIEYGIEILSKSKNLNKEIYLFSDFQRINFIEPETERNLDAENINFYGIKFPIENIDNLAVTGFDFENQIFESGSEINFSANVFNSSGNTESSFASLFMNGKRISQSGFTSGGFNTESFSLESNLGDAGLTEFILELEDDDISFDNKRFLSLDVSEEFNALLVSNNIEDLKFVDLALSNSTNIYTRKINFSQLPQIAPKRYDAIITIVNGGEDLSGLSSFVQSGGGMIIFPGSQSTIANFNSLLEEFQIPKTGGIIGSPNSGRTISSFNKVEFLHPIFTNIFNDEDPSVETPEIFYYYNVDPGVQGNSIISLMNDNSFISEFNYGTGKIILFAAAPVLSWTDFPLKGLFAPLLNKSVYYLSSKNEPAEKFICGDELPVDISNISAPNIKVVRPNNVEDFLNRDSLESGSQLVYKAADIPGIYNFYSGENLIQTVAVNFDPRESNFEIIEEEEFENFLTRQGLDNFILLDQEENISESINQARFGSELWRLFLIIALILTLIEMLVARNAKKDLARETKI